MSQQPANLLPFYKGWKTYQDLLITALAPLSTEQLTLRAAPHLRSIGENTAHIIGARAGWFHGLMGEGGADIAPLEAWDEPGAPGRDVSELLAGLEATWQMIQNALTHWTSTDLDRLYQHIHDGEKEQFTCQWVIWHVIEHDLHHGGEISLTLGMNQLDTPDL